MTSPADVIVALSRYPFPEKSRPVVRSALRESFDWNAFLDLAALWGVVPAVCENLRVGFADLIPVEMLPEIADREAKARVGSLVQVAVLLDVARAFDREGIRVIVLKGPAVALAAYGDYSRRTFTDIDLMVPRGDIMRAREILSAMGYAMNYAPGMEKAIVRGQHALELLSDRGMVELHWTLFPRQLHFDLDVAAMWREAVPLPKLGPAFGLSESHLFLYLCAHGAKHMWQPLRWIVDLAQVANGVDGAQAKTIVELADRHHAGRILALGLRVIRHVFEDDLRQFPLHAFGRDRDTAELLDFAKVQLESAGESRSFVPDRVKKVHPYIESVLFWVRARERRIDQLACLSDLLFKPGPGDVGLGPVDLALRPLERATRALARLINPPTAS